MITAKQLYVLNSIGWGLVCIYFAFTALLCPEGYAMWEYALYFLIIVAAFGGSTGSMFLAISIEED